MMVGSTFPHGPRRVRWPPSRRSRRPGHEATTARFIRCRDGAGEIRRDWRVMLMRNTPTCEQQAPWTVRQALKRQSDEQNRIYYEPRCHEGNYGLAAMFIGHRAQEQEFAEGRGPDPFSLDTTTGGGGAR